MGNCFLLLPKKIQLTLRYLNTTPSLNNSSFVYSLISQQFNSNSSVQSYAHIKLMKIFIISSLFKTNSLMI